MCERKEFRLTREREHPWHNLISDTVPTNQLTVSLSMSSTFIPAPLSLIILVIYCFTPWTTSMASISLLSQLESIDLSITSNRAGFFWWSGPPLHGWCTLTFNGHMTDNFRPVYRSRAPPKLTKFRGKWRGYYIIHHVVNMEWLVKNRALYKNRISPRCLVVFFHRFRGLAPAQLRAEQKTHKRRPRGTTRSGAYPQHSQRWKLHTCTKSLGWHRNTT